MNNPIVVLCPLKMEAGAMRKALPRDVVVLAIGLRARHMPALPPCRGIILAGLAGGLDPALRVGDVVIDGAAPRLPGDARIRTGQIACADRAVCTAADKAQLAAATGAVAVEMESEPVRAYLQEGVAFLHVRAISDAADTELDSAILGLVDDHGRPRPAAIAALLLRRPGMVGRLRRLQADSNQALLALGRALGLIIAAGWPDQESRGA